MDKRGGCVVKRAIVMALSVILALIVAAPIVAAAQKEPNIPEDVEDTFTVVGLCDFPVLFEVEGKGKTIELPGGRRIITSPGLFITLTNVNKPENQMTLNVTGAFHETTLENGNMETVVTGRNLLFDPEAGFVLAIGRFSFVFDQEGNLVQPLSGEGQLIDICEALA
jgi:hypothetical protein